MATTLTPVYGTYQTITLGLAATPLASSATFVAGRESSVIDNTSDKFTEVKVAGQVTVGTTPTINTQILIYVFERMDNTPTYPDVMDGTDSDETLTSVGVGAGFLKGPASILSVDATTSNRIYQFSFTVSPLFSGRIPDFWSLFVTHNTGVALNSTGGNHIFKYQGVTYQMV